MDKLTQFYKAVQEDMTITLATAGADGVTMRLVSPVYHEGSVLIFTSPASKKYAQLRENPRCCFAAGPFFAQAEARFLGPCMAPENGPLRDAYTAKFADAFTEGVENGGRQAEFILLRPTRITGWAFPGDIPADDGIPSIPVDIVL